MTHDGHYVAYSAGTSGSTIYVWDSTLVKQVSSLAGASGAVEVLAISPDGNRIASIAGSSSLTLSIWNRASNTVVSVATGNDIYSHPGLRFSADGRFLTYAVYPTTADVSTNQVYLYDSQTGSNILVSHNANSVAVGGDGTSDGPDISADGRFVIYRSAASDLVAGVTNTVASDFLYDTVTGSNTILSAGINGQAFPSNRSQPPMFSGDGHTVVFGSWGNDLMADDFNQFNGVFAYAFLYAAIAGSNGTPTINWPASADHTYRVEFKDHLSDPDWLPLFGTVTIIGNRGYFTDSTLTSGHRFYQVLLDN
jgi:dipeptidyl aminopeptidase/acylaminoacyl peptidase